MKVWSFSSVFLDCICDVFIISDVFFVLRNDFCIYTIVFIYYCLVVAAVVVHHFIFSCDLYIVFSGDRMFDSSLECSVFCFHFLFVVSNI